MKIPSNLPPHGRLVVRGQNSELSSLEKLLPEGSGIISDRLGDKYSGKMILCNNKAADILKRIHSDESLTRAYACRYMSENAMWVNANKYFDNIAQSAAAKIDQLAKGSKKLRAKNIIKAIEKGNFDFDNLTINSKGILARFLH